MRALRFIAVSLLAFAVIEACKDSTPTSPSSRTVQAGKRTPGAVLASIEIPPVGGFSSQALSRASFSDDINVMFRLKHDGATTVVNVNDPSDAIMARISIQSNGALPWHTHPGPAIAMVVSGALTVVDGEGCAVDVYGAGSAFVDPGNGHVHTAFNATGAETVVYVTYLDVPLGQSPLITASNPGC
jgi:quercetin dioxygenase-like cupin family protein